MRSKRRPLPTEAAPPFAPALPPPLARAPRAGPLVVSVICCSSSWANAHGSPLLPVGGGWDAGLSGLVLDRRRGGPHRCAGVLPRGGGPFGAEFRDGGLEVLEVVEPQVHA